MGEQEAVAFVTYLIVRWKEMIEVLQERRVEEDQSLGTYPPLFHF